MTKTSLSTLLGLTLLVGVGAVPAAGEDRESPIGRQIPNFVLPDTNGKEVGLADFRDSKYLIVVFLGAECPISNAYLPILGQLQDKYDPQLLQVVGIHSKPGESAEKIRQHTEEYGIRFPVLVDVEQSALSLLGADRTAQAYLLDSRRMVRYRGRIDDRFGYTHKRAEPQKQELVAALDELLAGKEVSVAETETAGCAITRRNLGQAAQEITYSKHVGPILRENCASCHHPGTAAPFSLTNYEEAGNWAEMIREVVVERRMPPWHADPRYGKFDNSRSLTQVEIDTVTAWVDAGAPQGEPSAEAAPTWPDDGWRIGKPDVVFQMPREFTVPAQGEVQYQYFLTPTNFEQDMWLQAAEVRPGNRAAVHHVVILYRVNGGQPVWVCATAPGAEPLSFQPGFGRKIPAGAELIWQVHYTPTGKEERDRSELGFVFCKEPPEHDVTTHGIENKAFVIPPGAANHEVVSGVPVFRDAVVLALFPHMHLRGKDFEYRAVYPDGHEETLLSVPQYDFNWQHGYRFATPLRLPAGSMVRCIAHFDNSAANPANPDPTQEVRWGDQTWEEMMIGYIDYYYE